jgi:acetamidase/formamidase
LEHKQNWAATRWHLDRDRNVATLEDAPTELRNFSVPVRPMLGGIGVAPEAGQPPLSTQDSGEVGGNMDYNRITEGATVYLPVFQPGALLYLGDAHALQGDGELNGNALETSMDIEFSVDVQREKDIGEPRVEDQDYLMAIGLAGSLDAAIRLATSDLARWLENDYKLTGPGVAAVLGTSTEYTVSEMPDRNVGIVAKLRKQALATIRPTP